MAASLFAWLFNSVELTCLPAALKALILHSFFLFSYVNALNAGGFSQKAADSQLAVRGGWAVFCNGEAAGSPYGSASRKRSSTHRFSPAESFSNVSTEAAARPCSKPRAQITQLGGCLLSPVVFVPYLFKIFGQPLSEHYHSPHFNLILQKLKKSVQE